MLGFSLCVWRTACLLLCQACIPCLLLNNHQAPCIVCQLPSHVTTAAADTAVWWVAAAAALGLTHLVLIFFTWGSCTCCYMLSGGEACALLQPVQQCGMGKLWYPVSFGCRQVWCVNCMGILYSPAPRIICHNANMAAQVQVLTNAR